MDFLRCLLAAQAGDNAGLVGIMEMYAPLLYRESTMNGYLDEDLLQELRITLILCVRRFRVVR